MSGLTDERVDADLSLDGFNPDEDYPEHGHEALRTAYRAGWEGALTEVRWSREAVVDALVMSPLSDTAGTDLRPFEAAADAVLTVLHESLRP